MRWRRFLVLVRGLSPLSAFIGAVSSMTPPTDPHAPIILDTDEGERAVLRLLGG